jgi:hypothetical protein
MYKRYADGFEKFAASGDQAIFQCLCALDTIISRFRELPTNALLLQGNPNEQDAEDFRIHFRKMVRERTLPLIPFRTAPQAAPGDSASEYLANLVNLPRNTSSSSTSSPLQDAVGAVTTASPMDATMALARASQSVPVNQRKRSIQIDTNDDLIDKKFKMMNNWCLGVS